MTAHVFVAVSKEDTDAIITQLRSLQAERDEALASARSSDEHVQRIAREAEAGMAALSDIDAFWDAYGTAGNRGHLSIAEQAASTLNELEAAESKLSLLEARLRASEKVCEAARRIAQPTTPDSVAFGVFRVLGDALAEWDTLEFQPYGPEPVPPAPFGPGTRVKLRLAPNHHFIVAHSREVPGHRWVCTLEGHEGEWDVGQFEPAGAERDAVKAQSRRKPTSC